MPANRDKPAGDEKAHEKLYCTRLWLSYLVISSVITTESEAQNWQLIGSNGAHHYSDFEYTLITMNVDAIIPGKTWGGYHRASIIAPNLGWYDAPVLRLHIPTVREEYSETSLSLSQSRWALLLFLNGMSLLLAKLR